MQKNSLVDSFGRTIDYLRLSVTEYCNFRCLYCMPDMPEFYEDGGAIPLSRLLDFVKVAIDCGIRKIRITGGEPLLRKGLVDFITKIYQYNPQIDLALTTNGFYLKKLAAPLKQSGLRRLNISLDSLNPHTIMLISKKDALSHILEGIHEALRVGFKVKINMVPLFGVNHKEILQMLDFCKDNNLNIRFIEYMENKHGVTQGMKEADILREITKKYEVEKIQKDVFGPATLFNLKDYSYTFGIIAPHNDDFCQTCNRIRLSSEGKIIPCLYHQNAIDISPYLQSGNIEQMKTKLQEAVINKPEKNDWINDTQSDRAFYKTGG